MIKLQTSLQLSFTFQIFIEISSPILGQNIFMGSGGSAVVQHLARHCKVKGLSPTASTATESEDKLAISLELIQPKKFKRFRMTGQGILKGEVSLYR